MKESLRQRWFGDQQQDEDQAEEQLSVDAAKIAVFLRDDYLSEGFEPWLREHMAAHDPLPAKTNEEFMNMNYQIGVRDGFKLVLARLQELRDQIRGHYG
jgi:hypothetical protein